RYVKNFDFRLNVEFKHRSREFFDKLRWIFINLPGEVDRTRGQRGHIGFEIQHPSTFVLATAAPAGGELYDHLGTMLQDPFLDLRKKMRIRAGAFIRITHVNMNDRRPGFECFVRGFNLLVGRNRYCRRVSLARDCSCDSDGNYCRSGHWASPGLLNEMDRPDVAPLRDLLEQRD